MTTSEIDGVIDSNTDLSEFTTDKEEVKELKKEKKTVNYHLSKLIESLFIWVSKKKELTDEQIEDNIEFDEPDKDLIDTALNPLVDKVLRLIGLEEEEILAFSVLIIVIIPRIIFLLSHLPKEKRKEEKKEAEINE